MFTKSEMASRMKFDLTDLRIFLTVMETGSLTAAAARCNVVTAAVSARMRKLEDTFGLTLFERKGRGIRPTLAAVSFVGDARQLLLDATRFEQRLSGFAEGHGSTIRVISNTNMLSEHMPQVLGAFLAANPSVNIQLEDRPSLEAVRLLREGHVELAIVAAPADMDGLERFRFVPDRLAVVVPQGFEPADQKGDPGADRREDRRGDRRPGLHFAQVIAHPIIGPGETAALNRFMHRRATELGRTINIRVQVPGFEAQCRMVAAGAGLAIMAESAALRFSTGLAVRVAPLAEDWAERELYVCTRYSRELSAPARRLYDCLGSYAGLGEVVALDRRDRAARPVT